MPYRIAVRGTGTARGDRKAQAVDLIALTPATDLQDPRDIANRRWKTEVKSAHRGRVALWSWSSTTGQEANRGNDYLLRFGAGGPQDRITHVASLSHPTVPRRVPNGKAPICEVPSGSSPPLRLGQQAPGRP